MKPSSRASKVVKRDLILEVFPKSVENPAVRFKSCSIKLWSRLFPAGVSVLGQTFVCVAYEGFVYTGKVLLICRPLKGDKILLPFPAASTLVSKGVSIRRTPASDWMRQFWLRPFFGRTLVCLAYEGFPYTQKALPAFDQMHLPSCRIAGMARLICRVFL